jgi:oligopeptide transport system permease protein
MPDRNLIHCPVQPDRRFPPHGSGACARSDAKPGLGTHRPVALSVALAFGIVVLLAWPWFSHPAVARYLPVACTWSPAAPSEPPHRPPDATHWFGTDAQGRDLLSRIIHGARLSVLVGALAGVTGLVMGVGWGTIAVWAGGRWDALLMRIADWLGWLPAILLVLLLITWIQPPIRSGLPEPATVGTGFQGHLLLLIVGLGAVCWMPIARVLRDQLLFLGQSGPVEAARVLGFSPFWTFRRHIGPHLGRWLLASLLATIPVVIFYETFLSSVGLGVQAPLISLGSLLAEGVTGPGLKSAGWWILLFPAATLAVVLLTFHGLSSEFRKACWNQRG